MLLWFGWGQVHGCLPVCLRKAAALAPNPSLLRNGLIGAVKPSALKASIGRFTHRMPYYLLVEVIVPAVGHRLARLPEHGALLHEGWV